MDMSSMELVIATFCVLVSMVLLSCLCCLCMKFSFMLYPAHRSVDRENLGCSVKTFPITYCHCTLSTEFWRHCMLSGGTQCYAFSCCQPDDLKMQRYIVKTAKKRGINVDLEKLDPKYVGRSPSTNENCTIIIPDVAIIL